MFSKATDFVTRPDFEFYKALLSRTTVRCLHWTAHRCARSPVPTAGASGEVLKHRKTTRPVISSVPTGSTWRWALRGGLMHWIATRPITSFTSADPTGSLAENGFLNQTSMRGVTRKGHAGLLNNRVKGAAAVSKCT